MRAREGLAWPGRSAVALLLWVALAGCGGGEIRTYEVQGVVRDVQPAHGQVVIEHEEIPDLMPAMTMSFDVADAALLEGLAPGQRVRFLLEHAPRRLRILALEPVGGIAADVAAGREAAPGPGAPAPDFELEDQDERPLRLSDLGGKAVLLDFVYTRCNGPCPILTGLHVDLQRRLPPELATRTHFVSVTLDPAHDRPQTLRAHAEARGVDLAGWSFVTGAEPDVAAVVRAYGVGTLRAPDGEINHTVATYLIGPDGRVARVYLGLEHEPEQIERDLRRLLP